MSGHTKGRLKLGVKGSKKQARALGATAGGVGRKIKVSRAKARTELKGVKFSKLT